MNPLRTMAGTALACTAAWTLWAGPAPAAEQVDRTIEARKDGLVAVENIAGSVRVEGWDKGEIRITGTLGKEVEELEVKDGGRRTLIKVVYPRRIKSIEEGADLVIMVPRGSSLEVECVSASVDVEGVKGEIEAESISGEVTVRGDARSVKASTISGELAVDGGAPAIEVESVSGRITVRGAKADVEAKTVSGDMDLVCETFVGLAVESVSGEAGVAGAFDRNGKFEVDLHSGDVTLSLDGKVDADFVVETFSGDIDNAFGAEPHRHGKHVPGQTLEFTAGEGGARVRIDTFSGDVSIRKR